ncbi:hypothetical protein FNO01nite_03150 [Flavobacterium noncentrifugens]|uniref:Pentapeptide MXKDX repeat protein n=1 Tax=Flavobacterium noncentrifugens TaxID=1128970 RepID=A0A1G8RZJ4_9FLAO|nr:hypothetical protein [Flavobacterium noncentrifugens]GEP49643.1 hypothetical protein FNO01nite_03150 [Flavobacterium noncentrifugens]SDJ22369.1 hypothetical protein SAMN04487935_0349 [Flavobacterium noncentrifugens]
MKNLMMIAAVLGLTTTMAFAQDAPAAKVEKHAKKHKTEMKADAKAAKTEAKADAKMAKAEVKAEAAKTKK